jgi:hypothetical protein
MGTGKDAKWQGTLRTHQLPSGLGIPKLGNKSDAMFFNAKPKIVVTSFFTAAL